MKITKEINPRFHDYVFNWSYRSYLVIGGYGSSKSYHTAFKLILKLLQEKRKALVVREVYETIRESCYDLLCEILDDMGVLAPDHNRSWLRKGKAVAKTSPMQIVFPNGSKIIFKGMDKPAKVKSINDVTVIWIEECSELKYAGYLELFQRARHPSLSVHFLLTTNPAPLENWVYKHFFKHLDDAGNEIVTLDDNELYQKHTIIQNGVYYHHSTCDDNLFLPADYTEQLEQIKTYDQDLYRIARQGRFGVNGVRVLPQFEVRPHEWVMERVRASALLFNGMDFGFEDSYNALVRMAVDDREKTLYIYWEYYKNHMTDDRTAAELQSLKNVLIRADSAEPKTIQYYRQQGFDMRACKKYQGSRLANTRKVKRFRHIYCSDQCPNCIRELRNLTYKQDRNGGMVYDEFNIDPHTFSAIWYGLDRYTVADVKKRTNHSWKGSEGNV